MPYVSDTHRTIAVGLIGMGRSAKPTIGYAFEDHARYLDAFVQEMDLTQITTVGHDWARRWRGNSRADTPSWQ